MVWTLFTIYKHFGDFVKCILRFCRKCSMKIIFHQPVNTDKLRFVPFLLFVCTTASFITQISSSKNVSTWDAILTPVTKQWMDIPSYRSKSKCYLKLLFTDLLNTNGRYTFTGTLRWEVSRYMSYSITMYQPWRGWFWYLPNEKVTFFKRCHSVGALFRYCVNNKMLESDWFLNNPYW